MITIVIGEDHQAIIDGMVLLLQYDKNISIIDTANDGKALLDIVLQKRPDVVITDIRMPVMDGIAVTRAIKEQLPNTKIVAFSMFDQDDAFLQMHEAGVSGYILKNSPLEEVRKAVIAVHAGKEYYDSGIDERLYDNAFAKAKTTKSVLSKSEREILNLIAQNKTSSEIAEIRFTAVSTVEKHRKNMIRKLGLSGKGELLKYAIQRKYEFN
ncbi:DNA-binding response regulator [Dokdonia sinensis]|uniref:DNA-binding response regulator n=1 Tax=Dokdonia sinensis TaxID=2479847 RepID=A0A3M0FXG0_9FLAO|nr:response regulator transcription factor [Dokdonia sinensis]RMB57391.1 DNA-binding response regulator [Dokdonia sinensis]